MATRADEKSLDSTVRRCIIGSDYSGRRKSVEADGDTEDPVTCEIVMLLGKTVSYWETVSQTELGLFGHKGL